MAKHKRDEKPKEYPLAGEDWSSQDESEESQDETEAKEINIELKVLIGRSGERHRRVPKSGHGQAAKYSSYVTRRNVTLA